MSVDNKNKSVNHQGISREEGQQNNTPPLKEGDGQRNSNNHNQPMSNMMNESEEQKAGRDQGQKDEGDVQQEQRTP